MLLCCSLIWLLFVTLTSLHLYANYRAVKSVTMETFNLARLHIVVAEHLSRSSEESVLGVKAANLIEPVLCSKSCS